jgi:hypothetical protein
LKGKPKGSIKKAEEKSGSAWGAFWQCIDFSRFLQLEEIYANSHEF